MSEEDSDSVITDSQAEEEGELPVIQLCGLVEELSYGNSALKTETEMFEKYYSRLEPRDHRMTRLSDIKITAAEFSQLRSRRKSKARGGLDRTLGLTVEQKLELVQKELEDTRDEIRHMRANAERDLQHHEAIIEEADIRWNEVQKAVHEFEKDILKTISKKKGSILATQKVMKYIEDMNRRRGIITHQDSNACGSVKGPEINHSADALREQHPLYCTRATPSIVVACPL
ncbi:coiled-coil domain-containing protein 113 isoform X1 [Mus musculus]|uniref:coiled-coil domain-containing protein 113 isoform X1 n=1 Tax=Mus musculus TaxID=10090 RepID=UPI0003D76B6B|nr:coiled-coil domain-containing protein 113 isoform X1 [Mus musculus]|eukprot:XP_006531063.1 PREDICTED: coiled-coil domain-containing protein 113 isoform X1 [Mus musculus]